MQPTENPANDLPFMVNIDVNILTLNEDSIHGPNALFKLVLKLASCSLATNSVKLQGRESF